MAEGVLPDYSHQAIAQVVQPAGGIDDRHLTRHRRSQRCGHGIDGVIALPQVSLDLSPQGHQVDVHVPLREEYARHVLLLGQGKVVATVGVRQLPSQHKGVAGDGDVHVVAIAAQKGVAEKAARDVRLHAPTAKEIFQVSQYVPSVLVEAETDLSHPSPANRSRRNRPRRSRPRRRASPVPLPGSTAAQP